MVNELQGSDWKEFIRSEYAVIDCYGDHCVACVMLAPVFDAVADALHGISFGRVNISRFPEIADAYGIDAMPTLLFFRRGEKVCQALGSMDRQELLGYIAEMLYR